MPHVTVRALGAALALVVAATALVGCLPEPAATPTPTATATSPAPTETATPTPDPTTPSADDIALPQACEAIYSPAMLAALNAANPPLNDPGVTMNSSQIVEALELLSSGIPTIRCSWGTPGEYGLATNVSLVDAAQAADLLTALQNVGFACEEFAGGTRCSLQRDTIDLDDNLVHLGEVHFFRGNGWVSTAWIQFAPEGYTDDIVATLWG